MSYSRSLRESPAAVFDGKHINRTNNIYVYVGYEFRRIDSV